MMETVRVDSSEPSIQGHIVDAMDKEGGTIPLILPSLARGKVLL